MEDKNLFNSQMNLCTSLPKIKLSQASKSFYNNEIHPHFSQLLSLYVSISSSKENRMNRPVFHRNLVNSSRLRQRLRVGGTKFFGKLSASGPEIFAILEGIKHSRCIKSIQSFEFDP